MENMIRIFECEEFGKVRTLKEETGRIVFCGKDVAVALGYSNTKETVQRKKIRFMFFVLTKQV